MKRFDQILRNWRYGVVEPHVRAGSSLLDLGGFDGSFLDRVRNQIDHGVCIDPLAQERRDPKIECLRLKVVNELPFPDLSFDTVVMLAVYEHLGQHREAITAEIYRVLEPGGRVLMTVPHFYVDYVLQLLVAARIIDGMSLSEHEHFRSYRAFDIFKHWRFRLLHSSKFQFGFNNFLIFEK